MNTTTTAKTTQPANAGGAVITATYFATGQLGSVELRQNWDATRAEILAARADVENILIPHVGSLAGRLQLDFEREEHVSTWTLKSHN
ncbi:MAG TPA: hypothetical protein VHG10_01475 [Glycomyces sp.]|nr:hypothetical protein [Glycomyces sp.]